MVTERTPRDRLRLLAIICASMFAALFARLWFLQVLNSEEYQEVATANITRTIYEEAPRGRILDRDGRELVTNRQTTAVMADQGVVEETLDDDEITEMLRVLAVQINQSARSELVKVADLRAELESEANAEFERVVLALDVDPSLLVYLGERSGEFPGVTVERTTVRDYPYGETAAHLLGFVGPVTEDELAAVEGRWEADDPEAKTYQPSDEIGKSGVEAVFEDELRGIPGRRVLEVDRTGNIIREVLSERREPVPGNDVQLTIDVDLQVLAERELAAALDQAREQTPAPGEPAFDAPAGATVGLDPRDGSVTFMASLPTYDPSDFVGGISQAEFDLLQSEDAHSPILNRVIQGQYAPGSTFKLITAMAAFEHDLWGTGTIKDWHELYDDKGYFDVQNCEGDTCRFYNANRTEHFGVDLPTAIEVSSDAYFYQLGEAFWIRSDIPDDGIQQTARRYGFGAPTGVPLANEVAGLVPDEALFEARHEENPEAFPRGNWNTGDNVNLSIGQGDMRATPIQMANAFATFANGGTRYQPNLVAEIRTPDGDVVRDFGPRVGSEVEIPAEATRPILEGLISVNAGSRGTAYSAFHEPTGVAFPLFDWGVAGKTGTAEVDDKADFAMYAAFGPTDASIILDGGEDSEALQGDDADGLPATGSTSTTTAPASESGLPELAVVTVLEEAGFGSETAAPMVARVLERVATGTVPRAPVADELARCADLTDADGDGETDDTTATTTSTDGTDATTTTSGEVAPDLAEICAEIHGIDEANG